MEVQTKEEKITVKVKEKGVECSIKYPRHSHLKGRLEVLDKLREELYHN